ncbi:MAPEG family protein [Jannaschia formosa]|nr:MAPEG family protein [Jannaschia formosa]
MSGALAAQSPGAIPLDPSLAEGGARPRDLLRLLFEPYAHAIASLGIWSLLTIALIPLSIAGKARALSDSGHPVRDYADPMYRRHRALQNSMEITGPFLAATLAAILAGAAPFWVNLLVSVFVLARIATAVVHVATENQGLRSATWAVGMLCLAVLAVMAVIAAFTL